MAEPDTPSQPAEHTVRAWKLGVYFLLLAVFAALNIELFKELGRDSYFEGFTKVRELLGASFDVVARWDDVLVTLYSLLLTFIFVVPIGWVYILTKEEEGVDPSLAQTLVVLGLVVCGVMMLVQDNLARAFGLVGVVAAVRYRNTLRDAKDAVYVFLAIGVGMGCGLQAYHIAILLSITICSLFVLLWKYRIGKLGMSGRNIVPAFIDADKKKRKLLIAPEVEGKISEEVRRRLEQELELQMRLWNQAGLMADKARGIKRPNAALIITATNAAAAQESIHAVLEPKNQQWQLTNMSSRNGETTFEYLGRLSKKEPLPAGLLEELQQACRPHVTAIMFRALRGVKKAKRKAKREASVEAEQDRAQPDAIEAEQTGGR